MQRMCIPKVPEQAFIYTLKGRIDIGHSQNIWEAEVMMLMMKCLLVDSFIIDSTALCMTVSANEKIYQIQNLRNIFKSNLT